jgi:hypothetical protein
LAHTSTVCCSSIEKAQRIALTCAVLLALGAFVTGGFSHAVATGATPQGEAVRLARALHGATTAEEAGSVIQEIMAALSIPVLRPDMGLDWNDAEMPVAGLFEAEIAMLARAFVAGKYMSLEELVQSWKDSGIGFAVLPGEAYTSANVESVLRDVRRRAEALPGDWSGLVIRLIDALGDRREYPFSLLGQAEQDEGAPRALAGSMQELAVTSAQEAAQAMMSAAVSEAQSAPGWDADALESTISSEESMQQMMEGLLGGNMWDIVGPMLQSSQAAGEDIPSVDEIQSILGMAASMTRTAGQQAGASLTPEAMAAVQASQHRFEALQAGKISTVVETSESETRASLRLMASSASDGLENARADYEDDPERAVDAREAVGAARWLVAANVGADVAQRNLESGEELIDSAERRRQAEQEGDEPPMAGLAISLDEKPMSRLVLDPVQVWLISMDLAEAARPDLSLLGGGPR